MWSKHMQVNALSLRLTHGYVGTWSHLDSWRDIGTFQVLASTTVDADDDDDPCDRKITKQLVCVQCDDVEPLERVLQALHDSNASNGCSHEYDCCGCRSYYAEAAHLSGDRYELTITSSRNY